jgi:hypothetical protein
MTKHKTDDTRGKYNANQDATAAEIHPPKVIHAVADEGLIEYKVWGWVKISANFINHIRKLKGAKLAIWQVISLSIDEGGICGLSIQEIADLSGYSYSETHKSIKELDDMGYLSIGREIGRKSLYYPNFAARGPSQPNEDPSRKTRGIPLQPTGEDPSSPARVKKHSSIKELKELKDREITPADDILRMSVKEARNTKEIKAFEDVTGLFPGQYQWVKIIHTIQANKIPKEKMAECFDEWANSRGYNPRSLNWLTDWCIDGIPPRQNGNGRKPATNEEAARILGGEA